MSILKITQRVQTGCDASHRCKYLIRIKWLNRTKWVYVKWLLSQPVKCNQNNVFTRDGERNLNIFEGKMIRAVLGSKMITEGVNVQLWNQEVNEK